MQLLKLPANFSLPKVVIPANKLSAVAEVLPELTSLATVLTRGALSTLLLPTSLVMPDITATGLNQLAPLFKLPAAAVSSVNTLMVETVPSLGLALANQVPLLNMTLAHAAKQWSDAAALGLTLPQLTVNASKVRALAILITHTHTPLLTFAAHLSDLARLGT